MIPIPSSSSEIKDHRSMYLKSSAATVVTSSIIKHQKPNMYIPLNKK